MSFYSVSNKYPLLRSVINKTADILLGLIRKVVYKQKGNGAVVLISLHKMGDTVFTIPAVKALYKDLGSKLILLTFNDNESIYRIVFPDILIITLKRSQFNFSGRISDSTAREQLKNLHPSRIIDLTGSIITASLIFNSECPDIIGLSEIQYRKLYNLFVSEEFDNHLSDIYLRVIRAAGINIFDSLNELKIVDPAGDKILLFPLAGWKSKEWGINNFIKLSEKLKDLFEVSIVVPGGVLEKDVLEGIKENDIKVIETYSTEDMIKVIRDSFLVISNDSGPCHVAELLGKKNITLFGPTNPGIHKTVNSLNTIINEVLLCSPLNSKLCFANGGKDCPNNQCMIRIPVEKVISAAECNE